LPKKYLDNEINTYVGFLEFFCGVGVSIDSVIFMAHEVNLWAGVDSCLLECKWLWSKPVSAEKNPLSELKIK
jgi:hypothetical protein